MKSILEECGICESPTPMTGLMPLVHDKESPFYGTMGTTASCNVCGASASEAPDGSVITWVSIDGKTIIQGAPERTDGTTVIPEWNTIIMKDGKFVVEGDMIVNGDIVSEGDFSTVKEECLGDYCENKNECSECKDDTNETA